MTERNLLLTPGPTPVPQEVLDKMAEPMIHHRTPQYRKIFAAASEKLKKVFLTDNPVFTLSGSGTLAMEASVVNFHSKGDEVLVVDAGKFGERWTHLSNAFGLKPEVMKLPYGEAVTVEQVTEALDKNPNLKTVFVELCETSTAVLHPIKALAELTANRDVLLIVDAVSGIAADRLETDAWGVDVVVAGSQKALMLPPGLAFITYSEKAKKRMASSDLPKFFTDLQLYEKGLASDDTPFTPALGLVKALDKALDLILEEGIENVFKRCETLGDYTREKLQALGLKIFSKAASSTLTAAYVPEGVDGAKLVSTMRDQKGVTLAGGQGEVKGKIIRICHMGAITKENIDEGLQVLEETLQEMSVQSG